MATARPSNHREESDSCLADLQCFYCYGHSKLPLWSPNLDHVVISCFKKVHICIEQFGTIFRFLTGHRFALKATNFMVFRAYLERSGVRSLYPINSFPARSLFSCLIIVLCEIVHDKGPRTETIEAVIIQVNYSITLVIGWEDLKVWDYPIYSLVRTST